MISTNLPCTYDFGSGISIEKNPPTRIWFALSHFVLNYPDAINDAMKKKKRTQDSRINFKE